MNDIIAYVLTVRINATTISCIYCAVKPTIVSSQVKRNSVTVTVTDPPIFQPQSGLSADGIQLENTYELSCTPDEGNSPLEFRIERESGSIHHQGTISGIIPGCGYRVECKIRTTSNLEDLCKGETTFTATNPHCKPWACIYCNCPPIGAVTPTRT